MSCSEVDLFNRSTWSSLPRSLNLRAAGGLAAVLFSAGRFRQCSRAFAIWSDDRSYLLQMRPALKPECWIYSQPWVSKLTIDHIYIFFEFLLIFFRWIFFLMMQKKILEFFFLENFFWSPIFFSSKFFLVSNFFSTLISCLKCFLGSKILLVFFKFF